MSAVIIPARYGSTRFPGKVLADIDGKPMIVRVAEQAVQTSADKVIVVTDNEKVYEVCSKIEKVSVMMSPSDLSTGTDRVAYAAKNIDDDIIINVQGDEPFIPPVLIEQLIQGLKNDKSLKMITACVPFADINNSENPSVVKVILDKNDYAVYFSRYPIPYNRDNIEGVVRYRHIGIYGFRRDYLFEFASQERAYLEKCENLEQLRAIENGVKIKVVKTDYNPLSVDTLEDLQNILKILNMRNK